jgi:predicted nucleic acid-binding protein
MLDTDTKRRIDTARDILVGKVLDPQTFAMLEVLPFGMTEANHFGRIRSDLYRIGQPIGPYDRMIAGHARATGMILVTSNEKEFARV